MNETAKTKPKHPPLEEEVLAEQVQGMWSTTNHLIHCFERHLDSFEKLVNLVNELEGQMRKFEADLAVVQHKSGISVHSSVRRIQ